MKQIFKLKEPIGRISQPTDLFKKIKKIDINYNRENFILICLNARNQVIHSEIIFKGGLTACLVDIRTIYRIALIKNANTIIIGHNHPSRNFEPSKEDEAIFKRLKAAGKLLQLQCFGFIIFNMENFYCIDM